MFFHQSKLEYKGLTIVLSQPSRFDTAQLLAGNSGSWFCNEVMRPPMNRFQCNIYDVDAFNKQGRKLVDNTKVVLLLGARAQKEIGGKETTLGEQRGSPWVKDGIVYISSFLPVDAFDPIDFETRLNPALNGTGGNSDDGLTITDGDAEASEDDDQLGKSRHGRTSRANYRFWLEKDTRKAIHICKEGWSETSEPEYKIYPNTAEIIEELNSHTNEDFFLDIETDTELNITCFGFTFGYDKPIYVVPLIRYDYSSAYFTRGAIMQALCRAMDKNTTIAHNGSGFDFFVLAYVYHLPVKLVYDTMIAMHRCFPEVEKSLGHCISLFTTLPYHKDEGILNPQNERQEESLWKYNGKDVFAMREVKKGIDAYSHRIAGLSQSIAQAQSSIRPYLTTTLQGIRFRQDKVTSILSTNDRKLTLILRLIEAALGKDLTREVKSTSKKGLPGSNTQCVRYFHDVCGYPVVGRSKKTRKPSLDEKNMLKLALKAQNPVIDLVLLYRGIAKESGSLKFLPWDGLKKH